MKVKLWIPEQLDKELYKYRKLPQHLKRFRLNADTEGYAIITRSLSTADHNRDIMAEVLDAFRNHWKNGNYWMVHLITKSDRVLDHLNKIKSMRDQVQVEMTIPTIYENRRRALEGGLHMLNVDWKLLKSSLLLEYSYGLCVRRFLEHAKMQKP